MPVRQPHWLSKHITRTGLIAWAAMFVAIAIHALFVASAKNVTPVYRAAAEHFLRGEPLYPDIAASINGFLYLPGFAVLYIPFDLLGPWVGDAAFKVTGAALTTWAAWSTCRDMERDLRLRVVALAFLISIPVFAGSFLQGQANVHLGAACWLMTLAAFRRQAAAVVLWSGIAILAKPLAIVALLLVGGVRPKTIPALLAGFAWALALPFVVASPHYVLGLYAEIWRMLTAMALSSDFEAADVTAIFAAIGWSPGVAAVATLRVVAALATFALALRFALRLPSNAAALGVTIAGAAYMCLFNPRAEGLTYAILALPCALVVAAGLYESRAQTWWAACAALLVIVGSNGISGGIYALTGAWYKPALFVLLFTVMAMACACTRDDDPEAVQLLDARPPAR